jgi:hypothetical protein
MYGQWHGKVDGDNAGRVLLSIDKNGSDVGSIGFQTEPGDQGFSLVAKATIS